LHTRKKAVIIAVSVIITALIALAFTMTIYRHETVRTVWSAIDRYNDKRFGESMKPKGVDVKTDVLYAAGKNYVYGNAHKLDIYRPKGIGDINTGSTSTARADIASTSDSAANARRASMGGAQSPNFKLPAIVYFHGGGFVAGDKQQTQQYCMKLANDGYCVFNVNYRLAPQFTNESQVEDVISALKWVSDNCALYGGDKDRIVIAGDSAGAYLSGMAACICTNKKLAEKLDIEVPVNRDRIKGVVLFCGLYDLVTTSALKFPGIKSNLEMFLGVNSIEEYNKLDDYSVTNNVTSAFPPTFISAGEADFLYPETASLIRVLKEKDVACKSLLFGSSVPDTYHDYQLNLDSPPAKKALRQTIDFLDAVTKE
jgi:acetyl esterase/lipase